MPGKIRFNIDDDVETTQQGNAARSGWSQSPPITTCGNDDDDAQTDSDGVDGDEEEEEEPLQIEDFSSNTPFEKLVLIIERSFRKRKCASGASTSAAVGEAGNGARSQQDTDSAPSRCVKWTAGWRERGGGGDAAECAVLTLTNWNDPHNVAARTQPVAPAFIDPFQQHTRHRKESAAATAPPPVLEDGDVVVLPNPLLPLGAPQPQTCAWALEWCSAASSPQTTPTTTTAACASTCGDNLTWSFPLLCMDDAVVIRPLELASCAASPHQHQASSDALPSTMFHPQLALSAATSAAECIRSEVHRRARHPPAAVGATDPKHVAPSTTQAFTSAGIAPAMFVPLHQSNAIEGGAATNGDFQPLWLGTLLSVDDGRSSSAFRKRTTGLPTCTASSVAQRFRAESLRACPAPCRFVGDVVDMMLLQIGLKCRVLPLQLELHHQAACLATVVASTGATVPTTQQRDVAHGKSKGLRAFGNVGSVWVTVEHRYQLAPSKRRCDWEDVLEAYHLERQLLLCGGGQALSASTPPLGRTPSASSMSSSMSSSAALYASGLTWGTSVNPIAHLELTVAWPWSDASSVVDSTVKSSFDITTPATATATGTGAQSLAPTVVLATLSRTNRFELSRRASGTLSEVAYAAMHHCTRIADDLTAQSSADLRTQQGTHRRISPVELATLAMAIFGEEGPLPPMEPAIAAGGTDDVRTFVCSAMPSVLGSPRHFASTRHIFNRFAKACSLMEDPDDMHSLWVALVDKLRTVIDFDVSGNGDWRYFIDPGQRVLPAADHESHGGAQRHNQHKDPTTGPSSVRASAAIRPLAPLLTAVGSAERWDSGDADTMFAMDLEAPLVMQKLQLLWSTGALLSEHDHLDDGGADDDDPAEGTLLSTRHDVQPATAQHYGWDEDDELLFDCEERTEEEVPEADAPASSDNVVTNSTATNARNTTDATTTESGATPTAPASDTAPPSSKASAGQLELLCARRLLVAPPPVPYPLMTRDQIEAQERDLLKLGSNRRAESTRRWIMSQHLAHEMSLFLYVNQKRTTPGGGGEARREEGLPQHNATDVSFADFVRWHSPRDFEAADAMEEGRPPADLVERFLTGACSDAEFSNRFLSRRMQCHDTPSGDVAQGGEGHLWWSLWRQAKPKSLRALKRQMFTLHESIAVTLDWLENHYTLEELLGDVFLANVMNAVVPMVEVLRPAIPPPPAPESARSPPPKDEATACKGSSPAIARRLAAIHTACRRLERPGATGGGWSTADAETLRGSMKHIIGHVEALEDDVGVAFALRRLLFGGRSPLSGNDDGTALVEALTMQCHNDGQTGGDGDEADQHPNPHLLKHQPLAVAVPLSLWHKAIAPTVASRFRTSSTAAGIDDDSTRLSLHAAHCHLVCVAERPVGASSVSRPLLQSMHCTWSWDAHGDGDGGVSPVPETRAREGWTTAAHPTFFVRCALMEEVQ